MPSELYGGVGVDLLYPSSLDMNQFSEPEWTSANIAPLPASDYSSQDTYPTPAEARPPPIEVSAVPSHMNNIPRPKSSPSTFGPNVEDLLFAENPFKQEQQFFPSPQQSRASSPFVGQDYQGSSRNSPARQMPVPIAPDPMGVRQLQSMKRMREEEEGENLGQQRKRKRAVSATGPVELNEEETLLLKLKEEENLPWKDIAARFQSDVGKTYQVPALQMRFKRLRERMRAWTENDIQALEEAYDYWEKCQFDIISAKMLEFGASERWAAKYCARKWAELHPGAATAAPSYGRASSLPPPYATVYNGGRLSFDTISDGCSLPDDQPFHQPLSYASAYATGYLQHPTPSAAAPSAAAPSTAAAPSPSSGPAAFFATDFNQPGFLSESWTSRHPSPVDPLLRARSHSPSPAAAVLNAIRAASHSPAPVSSHPQSHRMAMSRPSSALGFMPSYEPRMSPRQATF